MTSKFQGGVPTFEAVKAIRSFDDIEQLLGGRNVIPVKAFIFALASWGMLTLVSAGIAGPFTLFCGFVFGVVSVLAVVVYCGARIVEALP